MTNKAKMGRPKSRIQFSAQSRVHRDQWKESVWVSFLEEGNLVLVTETFPFLCLGVEAMCNNEPHPSQST